MDKIMRALALLCLLPLVAACSGGDDATAEMDHGAMDHDATAHGGLSFGEVSNEPLAPLPDDGVTPVVDIRAAWMRPHAGGATVTAAYFAARLTEGSADRLLEARIDGASSVELHGHTMDENGVMRMRPIDPPLLGAEGPLVFTPGGRHLMVFGLDAVAEGDEVSGVLVFERAGETPVTFAVRALPPGQISEY